MSISAKPSVTSRDPAKSKRIAIDHHLLEDRILKYQKAIKDGDNSEREIRYAQIVEIYKPQKYLKYWSRKYLFLFDSEEDFRADFIQIFCAAISAWVPANQRAKSRYGGRGLFQNYFWGSLSHSYINKLKANMAAKRNHSQKCPICDTWCNTLSTHLIESHSFILFDWLASTGYDIDNMSSCPFCKSFRTPVKARIETLSAEDKFKIINANLRKHLLNMHSHLLFDRFHELHPSSPTISNNKTASIYQNKPGEEEDEINLYDSVPSLGGELEALITQDLSPIQKKIIDNILNGKHNPKFSAKKFNCTQEEYDDAMQGLQNAMTIAGFQV